MVVAALSEASVYWFRLIPFFLLVWFMSGVLVKCALEGIPKPSTSNPSAAKAGWIIGKCENFITVTCIVFGEITGLAIIFAAKSMVRSATQDGNDYYLVGTLVNLVWGVVVGCAARAVLGEMPGLGK